MSEIETLKAENAALREKAAAYDAIEQALELPPFVRREKLPGLLVEWRDKANMHADLKAEVERLTAENLRYAEQCGILDDALTEVEGGIAAKDTEAANVELRKEVERLTAEVERRGRWCDAYEAVKTRLLEFGLWAAFADAESAARIHTPEVAP